MPPYELSQKVGLNIPDNYFGEHKEVLMHFIITYRNQQEMLWIHILLKKKKEEIITCSIYLPSTVTSATTLTLPMTFEAVQV